MFDIHSHILPETDDGSTSLNESVEMAQASAREGIEVIVATPHAFDGVHKTHAVEDLRQRVEALNARLSGKPRIELGCELRFTHDVVRQVCKDKTAPTLAGGPYLLLEFPHQVVPIGSERVLFELLSNQIRPVIAHPERNRALISDPQRFYEMVEQGVLGQVDTGSITGQFGRTVQQAAEKMVQHGLIHVMASDCHNMRNRLPGFKDALSVLSDLIGPQAAQKMVRDNPSAIVKGERLPWIPMPSTPAKKRKKWFFFSS